MSRSLSIALLLMSLLFAGGVAAQGRADAHVREGDRFFEQMAYARAIRSYALAAELGAVNEHVTRRLAESNLKLGETEEAERWYSTVVKFLNREPRDLYNYAEALKSNGRYEEAEEWMDRYLAMTGEGRARSNITGFARKFTSDPDRFTIRPVGINSTYSDFAPCWLGMDRVIFVSARNAPVSIERRAAINDQPFLDLYVADVQPDGDLASPRPLEGAVNSKLHEGPATASLDGNEVWFTRTSSVNGREQRSRQGISRLGIYRATRKGSDLGQVERFLFNNTEVSIAHPSLSLDGQRLYFISDMPGGFGGTDIYVCQKQQGAWGEPENLGPLVNTPRNEAFPFIAADGTLYFASNGHPGLGGLDIFAAVPSGRNGFRSVINLGAPVNSSKDDMGLIIDPTGTRGYFSSDREGGIGSDDLYAFIQHRPLEERYLCMGTVIDDEYDIPVIAAEVVLYDDAGAALDSTYTDNRGEFSFPVEKDRSYRLVARLKGRYDGEQRLSTERIQEQGIVHRDIHLVADAGIWLRGATRYRDRLGFIEGMTVTVVNISSFFSESQLTDEGGGFRFRLQTNEDFEVLFEKPGFFSQIIPITTKGVRQGIIDMDQIRPLEFDPIRPGEPVPLKHVRWAQASDQLDRNARLELDQLAERLLVNPDVQVELAVHSDARVEAREAQRLTQRQAEAMVAYLREKGVPKERMTARGYGTEQLLNHCIPGVACSEEEHAVNRRSEYVVTGLSE